jgi:hypothetical protein
MYKGTLEASNQQRMETFQIEGTSSLSENSNLTGDRKVSRREGSADTDSPKEIPPNAKWTNIDRRIVHPQALAEKGELFEERWDQVEHRNCVIVFRLLTRGEIQQFADRTGELRGNFHAIVQIQRVESHMS